MYTDTECMSVLCIIYTDPECMSGASRYLTRILGLDLFVFSQVLKFAHYLTYTKFSYNNLRLLEFPTVLILRI